jgi:homoserine O-acetyltransferase/O-succinyltransferase
MTRRKYVGGASRFYSGPHDEKWIAWSRSLSSQIFRRPACVPLAGPYHPAQGRLSKQPGNREKTMKRAARLVAASLLLSLPAAAHTPQQPPHQLFAEGDLKLESGEAIKDFSISYVTHGTLNAKKSNAILMVTAISGNHHRLDFMIGPGKALDTDKYFIVCTDAIANGFSTSPSNSKAQPRMAFPKFSIRDMVQSQYRLMKEKLGIDHVVAVVGPSMGGMQVLQWGVSHPDYMDALVAMVPLAKTPAWTVAVLEASRKAIMTDPAWKEGNYEAPPEKGIRLWRDILSLLSARTPDMYSRQFKNGIDVLPWMEQQETALIKAFDANDWIYQTWAYERHDVGATPGFNGDTAKALASIKAKTLILTGTKDLLNPEFEPTEAGKNIPDVKMMTISPGTVTGHAAAGGAIPGDVEFLNREAAAFLDGVTESGKRLN